MKKTAVEWLVDTLESFGNKHELQMSWSTLDEILKQAREMERAQIIDAYETSHISLMTAEQYCAKTYKQQEQ